MSTPTKEELQSQIRQAILQKDGAQAWTLWQAYQNKEYRLLTETEFYDLSRAPETRFLQKTLTTIADNTSETATWYDSTWGKDLDFMFQGAVITIIWSDEPFTQYHEGMWVFFQDEAQSHRYAYRFYTRATKYSTYWLIYDSLHVPYNTRVIQSLGVFIVNASGQSIDQVNVTAVGFTTPPLRLLRR